MLSEIYQIKVTLRGTRPPIWRRLLVPAELTLEQLHAALQAAMGWDDSHLHEFRIGSQRFGKPDPNERWLGRSVTLSERTTRLSAVMVGSEPRPYTHTTLAMVGSTSWL